MLLFLLSLIPLHFLSENYEKSSLCELSKNFIVSGWVTSVLKVEDGYKIKVCDDCCKMFYTEEFIMTEEHVTLCGRIGEKVRRC